MILTRMFVSDGCCRFLLINVVLVPKIVFNIDRGVRSHKLLTCLYTWCQMYEFSMIRSMLVVRMTGLHFDVTCLKMYVDKHSYLNVDCI